MRHPYGIDERFLREELRRRQLAHDLALNAARTALARQRLNNAQRRCYIKLLERELTHLSKHRDGLWYNPNTNGSAVDPVQPPAAPETAPSPSMEQMHQRLLQLRALRERILKDVMAVLSSFVSDAAQPPYGGK